MTLGKTLALLIPAYNAAEFLPRLLSSAAEQTEPFDEIWVYDDCSTDDTAHVAKTFGAAVISGKSNRGCSHAKNVLALRTNAAWLHFHDADDELMPNFASLARKWIGRTDFDVVLFAYEERDNSNGAYISTRRFNPIDVARDPRSYALMHQINPFCGLYRREAFLNAGGCDEDADVLYNEDVAMHIRLAFAGLSFEVEPKVSIINHRRASSMSSSNRLKCLRAQLAVMRKWASFAGAKPYCREIAERLCLIAGCLAAELDWVHADDAARLAKKLGGGAAHQATPLFRLLWKASPRLALRCREYSIRLFRRDLRDNFPRYRPLSASKSK